MPKLDYVFEAMKERELGLAPHYLFLWSAVLNLEAECVLEFGAGMSTRVILDALDKQGKGQLFSCSTDSKEDVAKRCAINPSHERRWHHHQGLSQELNPWPPNLDLILHDGSHSAEVVEHDLRWSLKSLKRFGLALIHDTQHSYVGEQMRKAVDAIIQDFDVSHVTLPYGFGLTILRIETPKGPTIQSSAADKKSSPHRTKAKCFG